jgi:hypothetical protein
MRATIVVLLLLAISSCGKDSDPVQYGPDGKPLVDGFPRSSYCVVHVAQADTEDYEAVIAELRGTWTHWPASSGAGYERKEYHFDIDRSRIARTDYHGWYKNIEDMNFRKICVSKLLGENYGSYSGYRILEFMASNNEGGAAFLIRLGPNIRLQISDSLYKRWASNEALAEPSELFAKVQKIWVYPERK